MRELSGAQFILGIGCHQNKIFDGFNFAMCKRNFAEVIIGSEELLRNWRIQLLQYYRDGSRLVATSMMECFVITVNGWEL